MRIVFPMIVALVLLCGGRPAAAQNVGAALRDLATSPDRKVRLAAVVTLATSRDRRAVGACARALGNDSDPSVRVGAMMALRKLVSTSLSAQEWSTALLALSNASVHDKEPKLRKKAAATHRRLMRNAPSFVTKGTAGTTQPSPSPAAPTP